MTESGKRTVWILGAGFSRPLGGPLLKQLLSESSYDSLYLTYEAAQSDEARWVYLLYGYGTKYRFGQVGDRLGTGQDIWPDAEAFLDQLDTAASDENGALAERLNVLMARMRMDTPSAPSPRSLKQICATARRLVAAECCYFLKDANVDSERWNPYRQWAKCLGVNDTLVTFNYDRVVEMLSANVLPVLGAPDLHRARVLRATRLLKMHGSVDWKRSNGARGDSIVRRDENPAFATKCGDDELCVATPGPTKSSMASQLALIWNEAAEALEQAEAVVFIGFRFPPSDAEVRFRILDALSQNSSEHLSIHIVLGPQRSSDDHARLEALLTHSAIRSGRRSRTLPHLIRAGRPTFEVTLHPLWAEDFLSVFHEEMFE